MAYQHGYYQTTSLPISVPAKQQQQYYYPPQNHGYGVSPPEVAESVTTGSGIAPSYGNSAYSATGSYAGSASEYDSTSSANGVDMQEYMQDRFSGAFDPLPLDRTLALQTKTSGMMNAKQRELMELQQLAQQRLARTRTRLAEGYQDAKQVKADLEWTQKRVSSMKTKASRKHPKEYQQARARYPSPEY